MHIHLRDNRINIIALKGDKKEVDVESIKASEAFDRYSCYFIFERIYTYAYILMSS